MTRLRLWIRCLLSRHDFEFDSVLPGRGFGGAVARFKCNRCGQQRFER